MFAPCWLLAALVLPRALADVEVDFENLPGYRLPSTWKLDGGGYEEGYRGTVSGDAPHRGNYCLELYYEGDREPDGSGRVSLKLDAGPYCGKRIVFRAAVRILDPGCSARLILEGTTRKGENVLVTGTMQAPIRDPEWRVVEVHGNVGKDLKELEMGISHRGRGRVLVDDIELRVEGDLPAIEALPPAKLEDRTVENLAVFGRLLGILQYYHPSDQAAEADWGALARAGAVEVADAESTSELSDRLEAFFAGVAPTLHVYPSHLRAGKRSEWLDEPEKDQERWVVRWKHCGPGLSATEEGRATSERERVPFHGKFPRMWLRPQRPSDFDLGSYVVARVATTLYADAEGTLPHAEPSGGKEAAAPSTGISAGYSALDRPTRIAIVILAWNALQHFGPLVERTGVDWPEVLQQTIRRAAEDGTEREFLSTLRRMAAELHDGRARVDHRSDWRAGNIPVCWDWIEGRLTITRIADDEKSQIGVGLGDVVLQISGRPAEEIYEGICAELSGATERVVRERALEEMRRRSRGDLIQLRVDSAKGRRIDVNYRDPYARAPLRERRPENYSEPAPGVVYVDLSRVSTARLPELLERTDSARAVVFDLRDGLEDLSRRELLAHLVRKPIEDVRWMVPVSTRPNREKLEHEKVSSKIEPAEPRLDARLVFLCDGSAIGEAEALLGLVEASDLGEIVGEPTGGTIGLVRALELPAGYRLQWTATLGELPGGESIYGEGVHPTVLVTRTAAGVTAGKDEPLEAALALLAE